MKMREAWTIVGGLGKPSKMPGRSYGLPVSACQRGRELSSDPFTPCAHCYAAGGQYEAYRYTIAPAQQRRLESLTDPRWADAMVTLLARERWFRWHDSGDLQGTWHLARIIEIAERTPRTRHWLPTHEPHIVDLTASVLAIPSNLTIRISADHIGEAPLVSHLPTSTVHRGHGNARAVVNGRGNIECKAYTRGNACGACRACWDSRVENVSYPVHGYREARFQLPMFKGDSNG